MYRESEQSGQLPYISIAHNHWLRHGTTDQVMNTYNVAGWSSLVSSDGS